MYVQNVFLFLGTPCIYSGGKKNPDLPIKSTENINMTCRHCKHLVTTPTDAVLCLYSQLNSHCHYTLNFIAHYTFLCFITV